jgi:pyruvate dehydrogenase E2 component (dihydrolipoamide acetyltransferase)
MATLFKLPLLGQTMQEGTILRWMKQEGEPIEAWEPLVEVMTDKVNMEVEPAVAGVVRKHLVAEGQTVAVGAPIAVIASADESIEGLLAGAGGSSAGAGAEARTNGSADESRSRTGATTPPLLHTAPPPPPDEPPAVSPRARALADEGGLDWKQLSLAGTGFEGMIVARDVQALLEQAPKAAPRLTPLAAKIAAEHGIPTEQFGETAGRVRADQVRRAVTPPGPGAAAFVEKPLAGMRKVIAGRLAAIYQAAPHVPLRVEVDMAAAAEFRRQLQPEAEKAGARLTYTDLIARALAQALAAEPEMNATLEGDVVRQYAEVNLGVAVALEEGLTVPVLRRAQQLSLFELSAALRDLAAQARAGRLPPDAYSGGTFTLTNLGQYGVDSFDPILNPPQIGILGTGRIAERLVARDGVPAVRPTMVLTVTFDHRAVDGVPAARLLAALKERLENPARLLL